MKKVKLNFNNKPSMGFTIVELLVSIVIIGVLAAITIVSYTGIIGKANVITLQSDLSNAKDQFSLYYVSHGVYPTGLDDNNCPMGSTSPSPDTDYCIKPSSGNSITLVGATDTAYTLTAKNNDLIYKVTNLQPPTASIDGSDWVVIGSQTWAKANLSTGAMVTADQTDNSIIEKYCPNDDEANCAIYGALYQWDEAMQYSTTEGAQGICPTGSHIPSDNDWKILEMQLGMAQIEADEADDWRGTDQGAQFKSGTPPELNMPLAGYRSADGSFHNLSSFAYLWSSSESNDRVWLRYLVSSGSKIYRGLDDKPYGNSIRCLAN